MTITATEFTADTVKYLKMVSYEDVFITENGQVIAQVIRPKTSGAVDSIKGILKSAPDSINLKSIREERLKKYEDNA